jgi:tRNA (guanine37-N1)-methyltransferase
LLTAQHSVDIMPKTKFSRSNPPKDKPKPLKTLVQPRIFSHYVMNLPASGINFVSSFVGLYSNVPGVPVAEIKKLFEGRQMPMVHVHCFSTKSDDNVKEKEEICEELSRQMGYTITPNMPEVDIYDVRDVAPKKRMFCATFRLPEEVAFRQV